MANVTIPNLGQVTAATSLDYLVITDSGETTTSKITKADFIAGVDTAGLVSGTGANSMRSNDDLTSNPSTAQYGYSIVLGDNATDAGAAGGIAIGRNASAGGNIRTGVAIGYNTTANGNGTYVGWNGTANGDGAQAFGLLNTASQESSLALGVLASAAGRWGMAIGRDVSSTGQRQVSIGQGNTITNGGSLGGNGEGNAVLGGYSNSISSTGQVNTIVGGRSNQITGTTSGTTIVGLNNFDATSDDTLYLNKLYSVGSQIDSTSNNLVIGGSNTISTGQYQVIAGGNTNSISSGNANFIGGGESNAVGGSYSGVFGYDNTIGGGGYSGVFGYRNNISGGSAFAFGNSNTLNNANYGFAYGNGNTINGGNDVGSTILGGGSNLINANGGQGIVLVGGVGNQFKIGGGSGDTLRSYSTFLGGYNNLLANDAGTGNGLAAFALINGKDNTVKASTSTLFPTMIGTSGSTIEGGSTRGIIIGGIGSSISGKTDAVMLGTDSQTALYDNTTHVENIHTYKTETFDTIDGGTVGGSVDVDLSLGTIFKFTMSANTTPNFINWREGQRVEIVVVNGASWTVPTATITGGGSVYAKGGSLNPTNSGITKYKGIIIDGDLYLNEELNFQTV